MNRGGGEKRACVSRQRNAHTTLRGVRGSASSAEHTEIQKTCSVQLLPPAVYEAYAHQLVCAAGIRR